MGFGCAILYRIGARSAADESLPFGSGVTRELSEAPAAAPLDSRFLSESFFVRFSRDMPGVSSGAWTWTFDIALTSGFSGEETAGAWSSSMARFCGIEEGRPVPVGVGSLWGVPASEAILPCSIALCCTKPVNRKESTQKVLP